MYKYLWNATPGDTLTCTRERGNRNDVFAVAVKGMRILLRMYLGTFHVFVRFLYVEVAY